MEITRIWYVYGLIDPRTRRVFYIGCSANPKKRFKDHHFARNKPATKILQEIKALGLKASYCIFGNFPDKRRACEMETRMMTSVPDVVNMVKSYRTIVVRGPRQKRPEGQNLSRDKPWVALGISRATYFRRREQIPSV